MGTLTDIALPPILRVFELGTGDCEGRRRGLATGTFVLRAVFSGQLSVVRKIAQIQSSICGRASYSLSFELAILDAVRDVGAVQKN
jgi:hypothetical protein